VELSTRERRTSANRTFAAPVKRGVDYPRYKDQENCANEARDLYGDSPQKFSQ